jgi:hypothetical protein
LTNINWNDTWVDTHLFGSHFSEKCSFETHIIDKYINKNMKTTQGTKKNPNVVLSFKALGLRGYVL